LGIDGEPYVGDQDQAFEDQQAQESFEQGKYNLGLSVTSQIFTKNQKYEIFKIFPVIVWSI